MGSTPFWPCSSDGKAPNIETLVKIAASATYGETLTQKFGQKVADMVHNKLIAAYSIWRDNVVNDKIGYQ